MPSINPANLKQKNMGYAQFLAVRDELPALLAKGYTRRTLYKELHEKGVFTCSYRRFCEYMSRLPAHEQPQEPDKTPDRPTVMPQKPTMPAAAPPTFTTPPKPVTPPATMLETPPAPAAAPQTTPDQTAQGGFKHTAVDLNDLI